MRIIGVLLALLMTLAAPAWAERAQIGPQDYVVGVPSEQFVHFAAPEGNGRQRMQNWCWAACVQMVLNYHGLYVKQEDIVSRVFGRAVDAPAQPNQILAALQGWAPDSRGRYSSVQADAATVNAASVIKDLEYRWPLIVGLSGPGGTTGHAYVLTAAYFHMDESGQPLIYRVTLRDPYPTQASKLEMSMQEFGQRCTFATRVHVQRL